MNMVIDADNQECLETFNAKNHKEKEKIKIKYENMNQWDDITFDCNDDLILWENE